MPHMIEFRVAELLCSRLCHDLISPVTAVNNGMELLADEPGGLTADIQDLLAGSAGTAASRLQFFRIAYGLGGQNAGPIGLPEAERLARGLCEDGKFAIDWSGAEARGAGLGREAMKLLLNLVLLGIESLPRGGTVAVSVGAGKPVDIAVTAAGTGARLQEESARAMAPGADVGALTARSVQAYLACLLADQMGGALSADASEPDRLTFRAAA